MTSASTTPLRAFLTRSAIVWATVATLMPQAAHGQRPQDAITELFGADRRYAAAAERTGLIDAIVAMLADSVVMPLPGGTFARTRADVRASLESNPANKSARIKWSPVRAVLSADGTHGFTAGYMTMTTDTAAQPLKYISYWVRGKDGWKVAAYKRARAGGPPPSGTMPSLTPAAIVPAPPGAVQARYLQSLMAAEKNFSDSSQKIGLGPAFAIFGRDDAINMGGPAAGFVVGATEISKVVGGGPPGAPSPVNWNADFALVAPSGDLGVTFGLIRRNDPAASGPPAAFFTIWSRPGAAGEWRYIAE